MVSLLLFTLAFHPPHQLYLSSLFSLTHLILHIRPTLSLLPMPALYSSPNGPVSEDPAPPSLDAFLNYSDFPTFFFILDSHQTILHRFHFISLDTPSRCLLWNPHPRCMASHSTRNGSS